MKFFSQVNLRRIFSIGLLSITLFLGSAIAFCQNDLAMAEVLKRGAVGISGETVMDETEYESAKIDRNQEQAARSEQASKENEEKLESETVAEKLNLDEITDTLTK